jgi:hypothetical protein
MNGRRTRDVSPTAIKGAITGSFRYGSHKKLLQPQRHPFGIPWNELRSTLDEASGFPRPRALGESLEIHWENNAVHRWVMADAWYARGDIPSRQR